MAAHLPIPQLGFGTLAVQPDRESSDANAETTGRIVAQAREAGYRHIDTAQSYGTERGVGRAITESGIPRDELYITSKLANDNHAPDDVRRSVDETLAKAWISLTCS
jgi:2,5-diketo-D-gluconate reductase A